MSLLSSRCCSAVVSSLSISSSSKVTLISTAESWSLASEVLSSSPSLKDATSFWMSMFLLSLHAAGPYKLCRNGGQQVLHRAPQWVEEATSTFRGQATGDDLLAKLSCCTRHKKQKWAAFRIWKGGAEQKCKCLTCLTQNQQPHLAWVRIITCAANSTLWTSWLRSCAGCRWGHPQGSRTGHTAQLRPTAGRGTHHLRGI